ncbi:hypothetical protein [Oceaniglobus trochenteri]|uniref:hypothetical protein n=1 Tax=Oceaniglobus trochenteri TaxID=2763260 RepID=UPI001CFFE610|nr:hypothetical protein [Oceaniglobus trochenteri]
MSGLDRIKEPKGKGWLYWLVVAVVTFMLMLVSSGWWLNGALWQIVVAGFVSGLCGTLAGRWVLSGLARRRG